MAGKAMVFEELFHYSWDAFAQGTLNFQSAVPGELRLLVAVAVFGLSWWLYRREGARLAPARRRVLLALRMSALLLLLLLLGQPVLRTVSDVEQTLFVAVLLDTSRSMTIKDSCREAGGTRFESAVEVLGRSQGNLPGGLFASMQGKAKVLPYVFDVNLRRWRAEEPLKAEGRRTNLFKAVHDLNAELRSVPLAAVVLLSDGCRNVGGVSADAAGLLKARGIPLYCMGFGNPVPPQDYEIVRISAPERVRRNTEAEVQVTVRHSGFRRPFEVQILRGKNVMARKEVRPEGERDLADLLLRFTPDLAGQTTYTVNIPEDSSEQLRDNNRRDFIVDLDDSRLPVLYIEGSPRQEYRFLRRAMEKDADFRVVGMLRLAPDRFYLQDANRKDKVTAEGQTEQEYLQEGFPDTEEKLFRFQAVILGDIEAGVFDEKRQRLLDQFVKQRGGGLLMLGGVNSFAQGGYAGTPVGQMLPVRLMNGARGYDKAEFMPKFTREGLAHPAMHLLDDKVANQLLWEGMPPLIGLTPVGGVKPGATLLVEGGKESQPVLAVQKVGEGRVAAFASGGSWYWEVSRPSSDVFHEKFWKQLIRWLVVGAREQISVSTEQEILARKEPVGIRATILGADLRPVNNVAARATITDPLGNTQTIALDWTLSEEGVYRGSYVPVEEGAYRVSVGVEEWKTPPARGSFLVSDPAVEFSDAGLKKELLESMAARTGGRYFDERDTQGLQKALEGNLKKVRLAAGAAEVKPLWDMPIFFLVLLGVVCTEWLLRRRWDLS